MISIEERVTEVARLYQITDAELDMLLAAISDEARAEYQVAPETFTTERMKGQIVGVLWFKIRLPIAVGKALSDMEKH